MLMIQEFHCSKVKVCSRTSELRTPQFWNRQSTQTLTSNTDLVSIVKLPIDWERVVTFSSVTQSFSFNISQLMLHSDHSCTSWKMYRTGKLMISELRKFQTYEHPCFSRGFRNSEVLLYYIYCYIEILVLVFVQNV